MENLISILEHYWPGTVRRVARAAEDFPDGGQSAVPFCGMFVELADGAVLPAEADVEARAVDFAALTSTRQNNADTIQRIKALEATLTPRRLLEGGAWMADLNKQISALRAQLVKEG